MIFWDIDRSKMSKSLHQEHRLHIHSEHRLPKGNSTTKIYTLEV